MDNSIKAERTTPVLYLVVPCYNEEEVIERSAQVLGGKLRRLQQAGRIAPGSKVMFVNDGSRDDTLRLLHEAAAADPLFSVVSLSGNYGHQSAILAGMLTASRTSRRWINFWTAIWQAARWCTVCAMTDIRTVFSKKERPRCIIT